MINNKQLSVVFALLFALIPMASCEKDDICVEGDTPLLVIGFYDIDTPEEFKAVPGLRIKAIDNNSLLNNSAYGFADRGNTRDSISIPLRATENNTLFEMIRNSADNDDNMETGTIDTLQFTYKVNPEFISRACGFIPNYNELDTVREVFTTDWIKKINIIQEDVKRTNRIHVQIFH